MVPLDRERLLPVTPAGRTRLAVLGSPIAHSKSPALHRAAYEVLGLDWGYEAVEVTTAQLPSFVAELDSSWRGLSLTMPLKRDVLRLPLEFVHGLAFETGCANTLLIEADGISAENTDVFGIVKALRPAPDPASVQILGAGATAASAIVAAAELGARSVHLSARSPDRAARLLELANGRRMTASVGSMAEPAPFTPGIVISTLPGGTDLGVGFDPEIIRTSTLLDVAYDPWPSALARQWRGAGGQVVHGLEMLVEQAVGQIRIFLADDAAEPLPREGKVRSAMRRAAGLGPTPYGDD